MKINFFPYGILTTIAMDVGLFVFVLYNWSLIDSALKHILLRLGNI